MFSKIIGSIEGSLWNEGGTISIGSGDFTTPRLSVKSDGKVGIGTATPQGAALDVLQVGATASFPISLTTSYPSVKFNTYYSGGNKSHAAGYSSVLYFDPAAGKLHYQPSAASVSAGAATSISTKFTIDSAGKVGIGTATPAALLHVYSGSVAFTSLTDNVDSVQIGRAAFAATHPDAKVYIKDDSSADWAQKIDLAGYSYGLNIQNFNDHGFQITKNSFGYVLNVYAASMVINEAGGNYDFRVEGDTEAHLLFTDASTDRVGIGTASPGEKLTVWNSNISFGTRYNSVYLLHW